MICKVFKYNLDIKGATNVAKTDINNKMVCFYKEDTVRLRFRVVQGNCPKQLDNTTCRLRVKLPDGTTYYQRTGITIVDTLDAIVDLDLDKRAMKLEGRDLANPCELAQYEAQLDFLGDDGSCVLSGYFIYYIANLIATNETVETENLKDIEGYDLQDINNVDLITNKTINYTADKINTILSKADGLVVDVNKAYVDGELNKKANTSHNHSYTDLTNKPTIPTKVSQLSNDLSYSTQSWVNQRITEASLGGGGTTPDLSGYVTVDQHTNDLNRKVDIVNGKGLSTNDYTTTEKNKLAGLSNYTHPSTHPASVITQDSSNRFVTDSEKATWNNKSNFDGNYNSLTNKPSIPVVDVTKAYVDTELGKKANSSHTHNYADSSHSHSNYSLTSHTHNYASTSHNHNNDYAPKTETVVSKYVSNSILQLSTDKHQKCTSISNNVEIKLPSSVSGLVEIHLYLNPSADISLTLPSCKWQNTPSFKANKNYELIFTYNSINWLGGCIEYV